MKKLFVFTLSLCFLFSCNENGPNPAEKQQAKMNSLLSTDQAAADGSPWTMETFNEKGDTVITAVTYETKSYTVPVIKTTIKPKVVITPPVTNPPTTDPPAPAGYTLLSEEKFDNLSDLSFNQIGVTSETAPLNKYFSTTITANSPGAFKSIVPANGNNLSNGNRSEQQFNDSKGNPKTDHNPVEGAVEYDAYYENWSTVSSHSGHTWQWHPNTEGGSAIISLQNYGGKFNVILWGKLTSNGANKNISTVSKSVIANKWTKHRWEFKWSTGTDGYVRLYIDDQLICDYKGKTAEGSGQYVKAGQNKWNTMAVQSVVYYDNLKIYKK